MQSDQKFILCPELQVETYSMDRQKRPGVNPPGGLHLKKCKPPGGVTPQKGVNPPLSAYRILKKGVNPPGGLHLRKGVNPPPRLMFETQ